MIIALKKQPPAPTVLGKPIDGPWQLERFHSSVTGQEFNFATIRAGIGHTGISVFGLAHACAPVRLANAYLAAAAPEFRKASVEQAALIDRVRPFLIAEGISDAELQRIRDLHESALAKMRGER